MDMVKRIRQHSVMILVPLAFVGLFIDYKRIPISILLGGALALVNLKAIQWGVQALIKPEEATGAKTKLVFFSMLRLLVIFVLLAILLKLSLINIVAVLVGLTVVFAFIIIEGLRETKKL